MTEAQFVGRAAERFGISVLTPMQQEMLSLELPAKVMLQAPTGSGKTLAFALPFLRSLRKGGEEIKGLILVPTRELALQVYEVVRTLATPEFKTAAFYGGHSFDAEVNTLAGHPDIVVATPGRLLDHIKRGSVSLFGVTSLVLDEYDKSLELGFQSEMKSIIGRLKNVRTMILTSATVLAEVPDFLADVKFRHIDYTTPEETVVPEIDFRRVDSPSPDKLETLDALLRDLGGERGIVFVNHREAAERVYKHLIERGFPAGLYHGGMEQNDRERALTLFSNGTTPILVSTDLASRGLDISGVGAVIHYHLPVSPEVMTHRNGRTGRMGAVGRAFAIMSDKDKIPDFFPALDNYWPEGSAEIVPSEWSTLHFNAGKREKISRGDIAGFLMQKGGLTKDEVGRINVRDHQAFAAVPADKARATVIAVSPYKIKNTKVKVTRIK